MKPLDVRLPYHLLLDQTFLLACKESERVLICPISLNADSPQGFVLILLLYILYMYNCVRTCPVNVVIKYADDITVVVLIWSGDETL